MPRIKRSMTIDAPPERVYNAYTDFDSWLRWVPHFRHVALLDPLPLAPGHRARIRERFTVIPGVWRVTSLDHGRYFAWTNSPFPGVSMTVDHIADAEGAGTRATLAFTIAGPLGVLVSPLALLLCRRSFDRSLRLLKDMLEEQT
jgi:hypothetical protein